MHTHTFHGRNVNHILPIAILMFKQGWNTHHLAARGGKKVIEHNGPVISTYMKPCERVLFDRNRDAHPYFHFFEALWILAGRNDVKWIQFFLKNIAQFSDDGQKFHGAYGHRLRHGYGKNEDQLQWVVDHLTKDPASRRAVATMFISEHDHVNGKDIPCNLALNFLLRDHALNLTVFNRSNDMVWGAYGANVVQFSTILEYVAGCLGVQVGTYSQVSNSFHVYEDEPSWQRLRDGNVLVVLDPYEDDVLGGVRVKPYDMFTGVSVENDNLKSDERQARFDSALDQFMSLSEACMAEGTMLQMSSFVGIHAPYFFQVAVPMFNSFQCYKQKRFDDAFEWMHGCEASDWRFACELWLARRLK